MTIIISEGKALKKHLLKKPKQRSYIGRWLICVCLLIAILAVTVLGHLTALKALFIQEEPVVHTHVWELASLKNASCVEDGLVLRLCKDCGEEEKIVLPAYGHSLENNACLECGQAASNGLKFKFDKDEENVPYAVVIGVGSCTDKNLVIPNIIGGIAVKEIAANAFKDDTFLRSVAIHAGIEKIGENTFEGCVNLYSIYLPEGKDAAFAFGAFKNTAYAKDENNWADGKLYRQGYLLEETV